MKEKFSQEFEELLQLEYYRYFKRLNEKGQSRREKIEGPPPFWFLNNFSNVKKFLIHRLEKKDFKLSELFESQLIQKNKTRTIYIPNHWDRIFIGCLREFLTKKFEHHFSDQLFSFRKGWGPIPAICSARDFIFKHRKEKIFVAQRDISKYGDNISPQKLKNIIQTLEPNLAHDQDASDLLFKTLQWEIKNKNAKTSQALQKGIPAGTPLVPLFENIYLHEVDRFMTTDLPQKQFFYGRYGDDILIMATDKNLIETSLNFFEKKCSDLELTSKKEKSLNFELPQQAIKWLGFKLDHRAYLIADLDEIKKFKIQLKTSLERSWKKAKYFWTRNNPHFIDHWFKDLSWSLKFQNGELLSKIFIGKDGDVRLKELDNWLRKTVIKFLHKKGIKKSFAWKLLRKQNLPSLNFQRRKNLKNLERN
jgi:hypothetical protein